MGFEFLKRVQSATLVLGALAFVFVSIYYSLDFGVGLLIGCLWGIANFWSLRLVLTAVLTPEPVHKERAILFAAVKFPILYAIGFVILWKGWFEPVALLTGFSLLFLVILLKVLGRVVMKLDHIAPSKEARRSL